VNALWAGVQSPAGGETLVCPSWQCRKGLQLSTEKGGVARTDIAPLSPRATALSEAAIAQKRIPSDPSTA
jgi:hypothetical protein